MGEIASMVIFERVFMLKTGQLTVNLINVLICFDQLHSLEKVRGSKVIWNAENLVVNQFSQLDD